MAEERLYENITFDEALEIMVQMGRVPVEGKIDAHGVNVRCLFHEDKNPSAWISKNTKGDLLYSCFSCRCQDRKGYMLDVKRELGLMKETYTTEDHRDDFEWAQQAKNENVYNMDGSPHEGEEDDTPFSWREIDLRSYDPESIPQPAHGLVHPYGWYVFYPAAVNEIHGPSESMKTWVALHVIVEALGRGEHAAFVDFEDGPGPISTRLRQMGCDDDMLGRVYYAYVTEAMPIKRAKKIVKRIMKNAPSVVIVNGIIEALAVQGIDTNDNKGYTAWARVYVRPFADDGACVILIDHTSIKEGASPSALGATAKMNIIQGASYLIEVGQEIAPARDAATTGWTSLKLWKDRPGMVRQHGFKRHDVVAELHMVGMPGGSVQSTLEAASASMEDMLRDQERQEKQASRESAQRIMWQYLVNNRTPAPARPLGGVKKTDFVARGQKPDVNLGRNGTERLFDAWVNAGYVDIIENGMTKWMIAVGDEFPGDRVEEPVSQQ